MAKTWVLHTETKGTGAQMVPLDQLTERPSEAEPVYVPPQPRSRPQPEAPEPRPPRRFRIVDVMTREPLVQDAGAREAVEALKDIRSIVDVTVYVWQEESERWRPLTFPEERAMWELAHS